MLYSSLSVYAAYFKKYLQVRFEYRVEFLMGILSNIFSSLIGIAFIVLLIDGKVIPNLQGWTQNELIFIYGFFMIPMGLFGVLSVNLMAFPNTYVIRGGFDRILLRPLSALCQVLFEYFNIESLGTSLVGVFAVCYSVEKLGLELNLFFILFMIMSVVSAVVLLFSIFIILVSLSFFIDDRVGVVAPVSRMVVFGRYPLDIFTPRIQFILKWVLPYGYISFLPSTYILGKGEYASFWYMAPCLATIFLVLASLFWRLGVKSYSSTGS